MTTTNLLGLAAATTLLVGGCSLLTESNGKSPPGPVTVMVGDATGGGCTVHAPGPIYVSGHQSPVLKWMVSDPGRYKFASNGIAFDKAPPPPGEFTSHGIDAQGAFLVKDKNHTAGPFNYSIHVVVKSSGKTCSVDPTVYNDGSCPDTGC